MMGRKTKIAIACQGGGSQTAFTAGALRHLLQSDNKRDEFELVSITGTSGGAICATLVWYALARGEAEPWRRLDAFWAENTAQTPTERLLNDMMVTAMRAASRGHVPMYNISPSSVFTQAMTRTMAGLMRPEYGDLGLLLARHLDFDEIASWGARRSRPTLLLGAIEILSGYLETFCSRLGPIRKEQILASCAVPNLFPAVPIDGDKFYWDGLFSDNPPITELVNAQYVGQDNIPDEIWVIKINPTEAATVPTTPDEISNRRNEVVGNVTLFQQLASIRMLNDMFLLQAFRPEFIAQFDLKGPIRIPKCYDDRLDRSYHIPYIEMSSALQAKLDYESKLDRNPAHIARLIEDGEAQARAFLARRGEIVAAEHTLMPSRPHS
jgi:NTE family protein